jgi:ABC-2 type transport system permease protein
VSASVSVPLATRGLRKLTLTEAKLLWRTPAALLWSVAFPLAGVIVLGLVPGTRMPVKAFDGASVLQTYLPIIVGFAVVMMAVLFMPITLATYRERGILRRMSTTPVTPRALLAAQVAVNMGVQVAVTILIVVIAAASFGATLRQLLAFAVSFCLIVAAAAALGMLVTAVSFTTRAAGAIGYVLFFTLMFFSGLWWPRAEMPTALRHVSDFTPMGAGVQALQDSAAGHWAHPLYFMVLAGYAIVCGVLAGRFFRWE